jgi:excisionase family DNA binding protein
VVMSVLKSNQMSATLGALDRTTQPSVRDLQDLPPVLDLPEAAALLGIGRTMAYQLVHAGEWPTPILRFGRLIKVPTDPIVALLRGYAAR